jgi:hypothetical protein
MTKLSSRDKPCDLRIERHLRSRITDLRGLWATWCAGTENDNEQGSLAEYGLCFDYVAPGTFHDQREAFFRYQLSWGGPSDEFRFFVNSDLSCHRIEYWFLDWFDGAYRALSGENEQLLSELWEWFREAGAVQVALRHSNA